MDYQVHPPPSREPKSATVNLRLAASLKEVAEKAAEDDSRTLPSLIQKLLKEYLEATGYLRPGELKSRRFAPE